jgi:hypothetical protein
VLRQRGLALFSRKAGLFLKADNSSEAAPGIKSLFASFSSEKEESYFWNGRIIAQP